ncbi:HAD superfamily hydrolase (TIGR01509 family) [Kineosphaera limosa]|uniref:Putative hydrolase n=1 Tax=Kineosphaera limosa NBRC 100340 TaxID=1184609 RepID=K6VEA1_9MICO|nr:HAD family phosphatase [Kineosphaera limosa]NYE03201.1 HAD superfamily hydrolase (TIGR01509 family) [Kineosphaera limosa]GAB94538.1 putative hydrolase [Kineosphaera limosa NBRC 100340]
MNQPSQESLPQPGPGGTLPSAVLWDMDGTLLDTEPYWIAQEHALVESFGGRWSDEHAHNLVGNPLLVSAEYILANSPVDLSPEEVVDRLQSGVIASLREQIPWRPGALELLSGLRAAGVPCAIVTMSWRAMVDAVVTAMPAGTFDVLITGDEVDQGKPHPEPYLRAAAALGVPIGECVAIEDSGTGAASALSAGARTIVVPHVVSVAPRDGLTVLESLAGVGPRDLLPLTSGG